jgi:DNA-binding response OmpR family regulator
MNHDWLLLVDDDTGIRDSLTLLLEMESYRLQSATDGADALRLLRASATLPRVILLDLMMPVLDGFQFRACQLADAALRDIPVLVLTAGLIDERVHALDAAGYLRKPIDIDILLAEIDKYCAAGSVEP